MKKIKFIITLWIAKLVAFVVNIIDKNRGTNYSGKIANKLMPDFIAHFSGIDYDKVIMITGTNGKSTTTNLIGHTLKLAGKDIASNVEGANMIGGVATTLIKNSTLCGKFKKEFLVLEIDERSFPAIYKLLPARHMGITNLQKDQAQRNGDPDFIYRKFKNAIRPELCLYLNNEEPRSFGLSKCVDKFVTYSVADNANTFTKNDFYDVSLPCPVCGRSIEYDRFNIESIGHFHCSHCDHRSSETPDVQLQDIDFDGGSFSFGGKTYNVTYSTPFYFYNYAMCIALCRSFGVSDEQFAEAFSSFVNPASRREYLSYKGKEIHYFRMKQENPETMQSALDTIAADKREKAVFIGLLEVKDFLPYYTNTFYFHDCNFKAIAETPVEKYVVFARTVCFDTANRMSYAGASLDDMVILNTDDVDAVLQELDKIKTDNVYFLTGMKPYKALMQHFTKEA